MKGSKKTAMRRVGLLCLIGSGITVMACQQEPVYPLSSPSAINVAPHYSPPDSVRVQDDNQPPKDVGSGSGGKSNSAIVPPTDSVRVQDDQPPKDVGSGSGGGKGQVIGVIIKSFLQYTGRTL